jgi:hypothetical protein
MPWALQHNIVLVVGESGLAFRVYLPQEMRRTGTAAGG